MFTTDTDLEVASSGSTPLYTHVNELADPVDIDGLKWTHRKYLIIKINREERSLHIISRKSPRRLSQIIGAKGKEVGVLGNGTSGERRSR